MLLSTRLFRGVISGYISALTSLTPRETFIREIISRKVRYKVPGTALAGVTIAAPLERFVSSARSTLDKSFAQPRVNVRVEFRMRYRAIPSTRILLCRRWKSRCPGLLFTPPEERVFRWWRNANGQQWMLPRGRTATFCLARYIQSFVCWERGLVAWCSD